MPYGSLTTRMPNGVTNAAPWQTMGNAGTLDPTFSHQYSNDFDTYAAGDWTVTSVGAGTLALAVGYDGGGLLVSNTSGVADANYLQLAQAGFKLVAGKEVFFKFAGQLSEVVNNTFYAGLIMKSTTPLTANDGVFISKPSGAAVFQLNAVVGGVATVTPFPASLVAVAAADFEVGFHIDSQGNVEAFFNPTTGPNPISAAAGVARGRVASMASSVAALTQVALAPSFGMLNTSAVARTLTADYIVAARNR